MANTKISALTANTNPNWSEEFVYAYNNANGKITLNTMKAFVWWAWVTTLNADANIWELEEWTYVTTYDLYYKSWEYVPVWHAAWATRKQMIFVSKEATWERWYFVFNVAHQNTIYNSYASFGYSVSSSAGVNYRLRNWDASLEQYGYLIGDSIEHPEVLTSYTLTQVINNIDDSWTNELAVTNNPDNSPYPWVTYTIIVNSVKSWQSYSITLWNWVTNPLGIALPTNSNKKCVITLVTTSTTTAIVTSCTIAN